jgi:uncharacterized integral membrane protein
MVRKLFALLTRADPKNDGFQSHHEPGTPEHSIDWIRGQLGEIEKLTSILVVCLFLTITLYAAACLTTWSFNRFLVVFALCSIVAVLGTVSGGALGFLFGIPRVPRQTESTASNKRTLAEDPPARSATAPYIVSNSNLEEISDWLTKIIVGLGLIHLTNIPVYIGNYRGWLKRAISMTDEPASLSWFLLIVTLAAAFTGFLFFYVQTRTRMAVLFQATEAVRDHRPSEAQARTLWWQLDQFKAPSDLLRASQIKPAGPVAADQAVPKAMPGPSDSADQWAAWAASRARAGDLDDAAFGWRTAIERDAGKDAKLREKYAEVLQALNKDADALRYYEQARQLGGDEASIRRSELLVALYVPPPTGFRKALEAAEALAKLPQMAGDVWVKVWHLSALGQKHAWHMANGETSVAAEVVPAAEKLATELVELVPDPQHPIREFLRQLIDPKRFNGDPQENDLESFKNVPSVHNPIVSDVAQ